MKAPELINSFFIYCDRATIGVLKYISRKSLSKFERIFWIICLVLTVIGSVVLTKEAIEKFLAHKIIIKISDKRSGVGEIPFPALSICPEVMIDEESLDVLLKGNYSFENLEDIITILSTENFDESRTTFLDQMMKISQINWFNSFGLIATWLNIYSVPFSLTLTRWGLCFTFNILNSSETLRTEMTSSDFLYSANYKNLAYIRFIDSNSIDLNQTIPWTASDSKKNLWLYFNSDTYREDNPFVESHGYHLIFHSNFEVPFETERNHVYLSKKSFVTINISPIVFEADDSLTELDTEERQCYLDGEKHLDFFKTYTRINCEQECMSAIYLRYCHCVPFYLIRSHDSKVCRSYDQHCVTNIRKNMTDSIGECRCFDTCSMIKYEINVYPEKCGCTVGVVGFESSFFHSYHKLRMFGTSQLLASIGGFLSLIGGISVISLFEIFYFLGLRNFKKENHIDSTDRTAEPKKTTNDFFKFLAKAAKLTSIHGLNNAGEGKVFCVTIFLVLGASIFFCFKTITDTYKKAETYPINFEVDEKLWSISEVPHPAITICPDLYLDMKRFTTIKYQLEQGSTQITEEDLKYFQLGTIVCYYESSSIHQALLNSPVNTSDFMQLVGSLTRYKWFFDQKADRLNRDVKFLEVITEHGNCFNINFQPSIYREDIISDDLKSYQTFSLNKTIPIGYTRNLLSFTYKDYYRRDFCLGNKGRVILHNSDDPPSVKVEFEKSTSFFRTKDLSQVIITPKITTSDEKLRDLDIEMRQCYFEGERNLRLFKNYSKQKCFDECFSNITVAKCGCAQFQIARDKHTRICGLSDFDCYYQIFLMFQLGSHETSEIAACKCLSTCNSIDYELKLVRTELKPEVQWKIVGGQYEWENTTYFGALEFTFGDTEYRALKRYASYGTISFLSNVGGLLSLFLGVSLISVIEVFYFFVVRFTAELVKFIKRKPETRIGISIDLTPTLSTIEF